MVCECLESQQIQALAARVERIATARRVLGCILGVEEALEDLLVVFFADADAFVVHRDLEASVRVHARGQRDQPFVGRVLDRVGQESFYCQLQGARRRSP